jgi:hypothetical protein
MTTNLRNPPGLSMTALIRDIIDDGQELIRQQLLLFRQEIRTDIRKTREATVLLAAGAGVALLAGFVFMLTLALLLNWLFPAIPLWGCFGIVGAVAAVLGAGLIYAGAKEIRSVTPLSDQSAVAIKETLQWTTPPK